MVASSFGATGLQSQSQTTATTLTLPYVNAMDALNGIGDATTSGSTMPNLTADHITALGFIKEASTLASAGGMIKFSTGSTSGSMTTYPVATGTAKAIKISFDATAWAQTSTSKPSAVKITYGSQTKTISIAHKEKLGFPVEASDMVNYSETFTAIAEPTPITFEALANTDRRFFMDNLAIEESAAVVETTTAEPILPSDDTFYESMTITIASGTLGATIRYTVDGTDPSTTVGTLYTAPFQITETTTVKAIAYKDGLAPSEIASETYTKGVITDVPNIAGLRAGTAGKVYRVTGEAVVTMASVNNGKVTMHIQDATGAIVVYDDDSTLGITYKEGDGITGICGELTVYNEMLELEPELPGSAPTSTGNVVTPVAIKLDELSKYPAQLVKLSEVTIGGTGNFVISKSYNLNGATNPVLRTQYPDVDYIGKPIPTVPVNLIGVVINYKSTQQIVPRSEADIQIISGIGTVNTEKHSIYVQNGKLMVSAPAGEKIEVYSVMGQKITTRIANAHVTEIDGIDVPQMVIVRVGNKTKKVIIK